MNFQRQTSGSVVCPSCGRLVGVQDDACWNCGRRKPGMWGFSHLLRNLGDDLGLTKLVIGVCGALYLLMLLSDPNSIRMDGLFTMLSPGTESVYRFGATGVLPVLGFPNSPYVGGRWWTLASAVWLHGGLLHVGFNMMWAKDLLPAVARLYGTGRAAIIYMGAGVIGFAASTFSEFLPRLPLLEPAVLSLGASGAILGLLGALVYYGKRTGSSIVGRQAMGYAVALILFGFVMSGVDNWAHVGGFGGGYLIARVLDPLRPERIDHLILGFGMMAASLLAVGASLIF